MYSKQSLSRTLAVPLALLFSSAALYSAPAVALPHNAITGIERFADVGPVAPATQMTLTVQLQMHNKAAFDAAVDALYTPGSPTFHKWMTDADFAKYAPTPAEVAIVRGELERHGLTVLSVDDNGLSLRVRGTASAAQSAFQTSLHTLSFKGRQFRANVTDAHLAGAAGPLVANISGLQSHIASAKIKHAVDPKTGQARAPIPLTKVRASGGGLSDFITEDCFTRPETWNLSDPNGPLPKASYYGNVYAKDISKTCAFTAQQLQSHYGLLPAYQRGWNGNGQNIVLVEALGYASMLDDANVFSSLMGLPALNNHNFAVLYPEGQPNPNALKLYDFSDEIALDIQWAHAMAPQSKIVVVVTAGADDDDFLAVLQYIGQYRIGNSVSVSYEFENESLAGPAIMDTYNRQLQLMAARGISVNFSSGDTGDDADPFAGIPASLEIPSDSPYATSVGGTSLMRSFGGHAIEVGWGNNIGYLDYADSDGNAGLYDPPPFAFAGGAGGGESTYFPKPSWQNALSGTGRLSPDISALADPNTGVPIVLTQGGSQFLFPGIGGTSLAAPIFSAFWAIANQAAGAPLGQAAPMLASMPSNAITDILRYHTSTNVTGTITDSFGSTFYPAAYIIGLPESAEGTFVSALLSYDVLQGGTEYTGHDAISFGTDSSLTTGPGWDNVTGFGVPHGLSFLNAAAAAIQ